jgi:cadmium resistance protein CadD (predicted permease)
VSVLLLSVALFASTNIDDVFLLVAFYADARVRARDVVIGQFAGIAALTAGSLVLSLAAVSVAGQWVGLLGVLPLALGLYLAWRALRGRADDDDDTATASTRPIGAVAVAAVTIANGSDNVAAYVPFFASQTLWERALAIAVFLVMTGALCLLAHWLVQHPRLGGPLRASARVALPIVLIALGVYIFVEAGSYELIANALR